jgi:hypothetical protein
MSTLVTDLSSTSLIETPSSLIVHPSSTLIACVGTTRINRHQLALIETPSGTRTHKPIPHIDIVNALIETLGFRNIDVIGDEYAISHDGMRMFGLLNLSLGFDGCRFAIGLRNGNDKSMRLALTVGYKVAVCSNMAFDGDFTPVLAKHSAKFSIEDALAIGVDKIQRNFEPLRNQIEMWRNIQLSDMEAKNIIYTAFIEGELEAPKSLINVVHSLYFDPIYPDFVPRTFWSLSNAFTSAFKDLNPTSQFQATAKLGDFLNKFFPKPKK